MLRLGLIALCAVTQGVYFHVGSSEEKCFKEEVAAKQVMLVKHKQFNNPGVPCFIVFKDKRGIAVSSNEVKTANGVQSQSAYMSKDSGDSFVCVKCTGSRWAEGEPIKWELRIDIGGDYLADYDAAQLKDVDSVTATLREVLGRTSGIRAETDRIRENVKVYNDAHRGTGSQVWWLNFMAIAAVIICAFTQAIILRNFFKAEKIV